MAPPPHESLMADVVFAKLKDAGLKLTPQRMAIVRELAGDCTHPTAQELFERLRSTFPTMSFATVYNTLDSLAELGLVSSLRLGSAVRFDPNTELHHHAVCDACGAVVDLPAGPLSPALKKTVEAASGFDVRSEERTYRGLCSRCS
jgi:Fe2+ or Zn2+ uptake regulation protein